MPSYRDELRVLAESIGSDGCTGVVDLYIVACWEHDIAYVTGMTPRGVAITKAEADRRFRDVIQANSSLRFLNPVSWWRWLGTRWFGHGNWGRVAPVMPPRGFLATIHADAVDARREAQWARARLFREAGITCR